MKALARIIAGLMMLLQAGCGYSLRTSKTGSFLANKGIHRIYVRPVVNGTFRAGIENIVFNALVRAINGSSGLRAVSSLEEADAELLGTVNQVGRSVSGVLKASDLNPKGLGSPSILVATEYVAVLNCDFILNAQGRNGSPPEMLWKNSFSRNKPFPANNQLWSLGSTSALINESELDRSLADVAELMSRDVVQSMQEDF